MHQDNSVLLRYCFAHACHLIYHQQVKRRLLLDHLVLLCDVLYSTISLINFSSEFPASHNGSNFRIGSALKSISFQSEIGIHTNSIYFQG